MKELIYLAVTKVDVGTNGTDQVNIPTVNADGATLQGVLNVVYLWAGAIAVLVIVIAGFFFVLSNGDVNQVTRARKAIISASVGLVVVVMAFAITQFILGNVG